MYTRRKEPYTVGAADEIVENDDILTLYSCQIADAQTLTDEGFKALEKIAREMAPDYVLTLYVRQRELQKHAAELDKRYAELHMEVMSQRGLWNAWARLVMPDAQGE